MKNLLTIISFLTIGCAYAQFPNYDGLYAEIKKGSSDWTKPIYFRGSQYVQFNQNGYWKDVIYYNYRDSRYAQVYTGKGEDGWEDMYFFTPDGYIQKKTGNGKNGWESLYYLKGDYIEKLVNGKWIQYIYIGANGYIERQEGSGDNGWKQRMYVGRPVKSALVAIVMDHYFQ